MVQVYIRHLRNLVNPSFSISIRAKYEDKEKSYECQFDEDRYNEYIKHQRTLDRIE